MATLSNANFVHTHVHTERSRFDGAAAISKLVMKAREMGFPGIACTDHGTVAGWVKFIAECGRRKDKKGKEVPFPTIKPLLGFEAYLARDHRYKDITLQPDGRKGNRHLLLIAKNWEGYQNLCRLSETSWMEGIYHNPRIDLELLAKHSKGIIAQSACLSSVINASLLHDKYDEAKRAASIFKDIFGEDFFLEVMFHGIDHEAAIIGDIMKLGNQLDIPVLASNDTHYIEKSHGRTQEALMCFSTNKCILDPKHLSFPYHEFYLKSAEEMAKIFGHYPQLLTNTLAVAERVNATDIEKNMGGMRLPKFPVPPPFKEPHEYLEHLAWEGMKRLRWEHSAKHVAALKKELGDVKVAKAINNYDFATYFLIKWDAIKTATENAMLTGPGRGSGYASVLLRTLGITYGPDPLEHDLLWERFLGFDDRRFYLAADFGLKTDQSFNLAEAAELAAEAAAEKEEENAEDDDMDDLFGEREVGDDPGGVDRY